MHPRLRLLNVLALFVALGVPKVGHADPFYQLIGARSLAMGGAHRGMGTSNDTLILNPAGMAATKRYASELFYQYNTQDHISRVMVSAVDSKTSPLAAGLAYTREWGNPSGADIGLNRIYFGLAYALVPSLSIGITGQNARGNFLTHEVRQKQNNFNGTAGLMLSLGQVLRFGVTYENFARIKYDQVMPQLLGLGASTQISIVALAADYVFDLRRGRTRPKTFGVGTEVSVLPGVVVRAGYRLGHALSTREGPLKRYVTGGVGLVSSQAGIELSCERSVDGPAEWQMVGGLLYGF